MAGISEFTPEVDPNHGATSGSAGLVQSGYAAATNASTGCILPLVFLKAEANIKTNGILIEWALAGNSTLDQVYIRRQSPAQAPSSMQSSNQLVGNWLDINPPVGSVQYQLEAIDIDGQVYHSDWIDLEWTGGPNLQFYTKLDQNILTVSGNSPLQSPLKVRIQDAVGRVIIENQYWVDRGNFEFRIPFPYVSGHYIMSIQSPTNRFHRHLSPRP